MSDVAKALTRDIHRQSTGSKKEVWIDLKGPASYDTGGSNGTTQTLFDLRNVLSVEVPGGITNSGTYLVSVRYPSTGEVKTVKFVFTVRATGAEAASTTDLSAERFRVRAIGI